MSLQRQNDVKVGPRMRWSQVSKLVTPRTPNGDDVPATAAPTRSAASGRPGASRERVRHLADPHLGRHGNDGRAARVRAAPGGAAGRRPHGGDRRQPPAAVRDDAGDPVARRGSHSAVPGCGGCRMRVPDQQRRSAFRVRRGPGAGGQAARDSRPMPATRRHLLRRSARPAQIQRARPGFTRCSAAGGQGLCHAAALVLQRCGREGPAR